MYTMDERIRYSEVDDTGNLTVPGIINYFQDCSTFHSEDIGLGFRTMEGKKKAWLLSYWQVVIERYPVFAEEITVSTFATGFKGLYGTRNFVMRDKYNQPAAYANSIWVFMDLVKGRPGKPDISDMEKYGIEPKFPMDYADRKIVLPGCTEKRAEFPVRKHHLDTNNHVNNCWYIQMALDVLPEKILVRQVRVEYKNPAMDGDMIYPKIACEKERTVVELCNGQEKPYAIIEFIGEKEDGIR